MIALLLGAVLFLSSQQPAPAAPTTPKGINFFSLKQDIEIGAEAFAEAEKTLPLVRNEALNRYLRTIGERLSAGMPAPKLRYRFGIVNSKDVNSVGFPGGAIYVNRGLIEVATNEHELAAILAHEIAHISARHGTAQLSRQLLVQAPISIASGLPTTDGWKDQLAKLGISFGVNASFVRYTRDQELEAILTAVRLLSGARWDPAALNTLIANVVETETGEGARFAPFVFSHPPPEELDRNIEEEIGRIESADPRRHPAAAEFRSFRKTLDKLPYPVAEKQPVETAADALTATFRHPGGYYTLGYPQEWEVRRTGENGAIIAPLDAIGSVRAGNDVTLGVMFDMFALTDRPLTLEQATNRLMVFLRQPERNQSLRVVPGAQTHVLVSDEPGLRTVLVGKACRPEETCPEEVVWVVTRLYYQTLFYMAFVAPDADFPKYQPIFEKIIRSARLR